MNTASRASHSWNPRLCVLTIPATVSENGREHIMHRDARPLHIICHNGLQTLLELKKSNTHYCYTYANTAYGSMLVSFHRKQIWHLKITCIYMYCRRYVGERFVEQTMFAVEDEDQLAEFEIECECEVVHRLLQHTQSTEHGQTRLYVHKQNQLINTCMHTSKEKNSKDRARLLEEDLKT